MEKHIPMRMCIACREKSPKHELLRISYKDGEVFLDDKNEGRGAYICKNEECLNLSKKKGALKRHFKKNIPDEIYEKIKEKL